MLRRLVSVGIVLLIAASLTFSPSSATAGGGGFGPCPYGDVATTDVRMTGACFSPAVARVQPGDAVTFTNDDKMLHAVGGVGQTFAGLHPELRPNETLSFRFEEEGVYPYVCVFHPGMAGAIVVGDGEGKGAGATAATLVPPADAKDAAEQLSATDEASAGEGTAGRQPWVVPVGIALALGLLVIAAIPMRRRTRGPLVTTNL
jgi:plastocyanin